MARKRWPPPDRPLAVTVHEAAKMLHVTVDQASALAENVEPYIAVGGVPKWPLRELGRRLAGSGQGTYREVARR